MSDDLQSLERQLLEDPFNASLRAAYAQLLLQAGNVDESGKQYELLTQQNAASALGWIGRARCALADSDPDAAKEHYATAARKDDFEPDALLERELNEPPKLRAVEVPDNVVQLQPVAQADVTLADVAGMDKLKKTLRLQIIEPYRNPGLFARFRKKAGGGVLLYGPPGCGKTLIARAIAGECSAQFITVGISDVLSSYLGESERNLALIFEQARASTPCVLFFDELDALAYSRSKSSSTAARTVVNEFLVQLDGFSQNDASLLVLAATNMPWDVDGAMKRPGRFSRQIFVPPPDSAAREEMLRGKLQDVPTDGVDYATLAQAADLFTGADIDGLIDIAKEAALAEMLSSGTERPLQQADFVAALDEMTPSSVDWLKTARNLVKFSGADTSYKDVEKYLKSIRRF